MNTYIHAYYMYLHSCIEVFMHGCIIIMNIDVDYSISLHSPLLHFHIDVCHVPPLPWVKLLKYSFFHVALERNGLDVTSLKVPPVGQPTIHHESPKYYPAIEDLETPFIDLVREVRQEAVKVKDLSTICNQLLTRYARLKDPEMRERLHELNNCSNEQAFGYLQHHIDELDCDLLYKLIMQIKNQRLIDDWDRYRGKVKEACSVTLDKCRREQQKKKLFGKEYLSLGFQTNQVASDTTIQRILELRDFLINRVGLEEAKFEGVANSIVTLFFKISKKRVPFLLHHISRHRRSLLEFDVTVVFVPGVFIYDLVTEEDYQYPEVCMYVYT